MLQSYLQPSLENLGLCLTIYTWRAYSSPLTTIINANRRKFYFGASAREEMKPHGYKKNDRGITIEVTLDYNPFQNQRS